MLEANQVEELICLVSAMDRPALVRHFREYRANFPVDFTDQFLENTPVERLRHIFVALCLQCQHVPQMAPPAAA
ncbi:MAG TPA: hypothetical protein VFB66_07915 [Tepidisphaeraceae bacterium]|jgi:hypothetical protein|nr:hypothetical protein [Tepidisphaeraceae bacterium]